MLTVNVSALKILSIILIVWKKTVSDHNDKSMDVVIVLKLFLTHNSIKLYPVRDCTSILITFQNNFKLGINICIDYL